jgi:predicted MPP superfamily phosphohydrolase
MVYLFFFFIAVDFILVTIHLYRRYRRKERIVLMPHIKKPIGITVAILTLVLVIYGHRQSLDPEIKKVRIKLERKSGVRDSVHLVFLSDLHLGNLIGKDRLEKWVHKINGLNPDIVIIGGDIINRDLEPVINAQIAEVFKKVKSRYGLYAVTGNHDYFQNVNNLVKYLEKGNIRFLQDRGVLIEDSFYLIGRKDRSSVNFGHSREALKTVLRPLEGNFPKILIDHQPIGLKEASDNGIDLQISGHTHDGQMFPVTLFIGLLYEKAYGHHQRGKTQYLVSSGVGTAGPPLRVGSSGEIVSIKIDFK